MQTHRDQATQAVPVHGQDRMQVCLQAVMTLVTEVLAHRALAA